MSDKLQHTALNSMADYISALDTLCGLAQRSLMILDINFEDIGLNTPARESILRRFLLANPVNRLHLLTTYHFAG